MTQDELKALFIYERQTGMLRRRPGTGGRTLYPWRPIGKEGRYLAFTYRGLTIYLHQAVWLWHRGFIPRRLDHKDRDTRNCRIGNLRECTSAQNQYNSKRKVNNKAGFKGVVYRTGYRHPWQARITVNGKPLLIGRFDTPQEAHVAYVKAAVKHAGEFARAA